jgi:tRNA(Ile)-lysidine synthase
VPGWTGVLEVAPVGQGGAAGAWLDHVTLRARCGGVGFQAGPGRPPRSLKKQYQEAGIAAWDRDGPLVFSGSQLVFAPGLGLDARVLAPPGAPQFALRWTPGPPPAGADQAGGAPG